MITNILTVGVLTDIVKKLEQYLGLTQKLATLSFLLKNSLSALQI